jgi:hypothetical protein
MHVKNTGKVFDMSVLKFVRFSRRNDYRYKFVFKMNLFSNIT